MDVCVGNVSCCKKMGEQIQDNHEGAKNKILEGSDTSIAANA